MNVDLSHKESLLRYLREWTEPSAMELLNGIIDAAHEEGRECGLDAAAMDAESYE